MAHQERQDLRLHESSGLTGRHRWNQPGRNAGHEPEAYSSQGECLLKKSQLNFSKRLGGILTYPGPILSWVVTL